VSHPADCRTADRSQTPPEPTSVRAGALLAGRTLRLDLHPAYLDHPRQMLALEWALGHTARRRLAVTYDELAGAELGTAGERDPNPLLAVSVPSSPHPTR
jgi:hypothetical protein